MSIPPGPNHRKNRRLPAKRSTRVICFKGPLGLGSNFALGAKDLSQEGICLILSELLEVGQEVEVNLESLHHRRPVRVPGVVVWARTDGEGRNLVGVRFEKYIPYSDFQALAQLT